MRELKAAMEDFVVEIDEQVVGDGPRFEVR